MAADPEKVKPNRVDYTLRSKLGVWSRYLLEIAIKIIVIRRPNFVGDVQIPIAWNSWSEFTSTTYYKFTQFYTTVKDVVCGWFLYPDGVAATDNPIIAPGEGSQGASSVFIEGVYMEAGSVAHALIIRDRDQAEYKIWESNDEGEDWATVPWPPEHMNDLYIAFNTEGVTRTSSKDRVPYVAPLTYRGGIDEIRSSPPGYVSLELPTAFQSVDVHYAWASGEDQVFARARSYGVYVDNFICLSYTEPNLATGAGSCSFMSQREYLLSRGDPAYTFVPYKGWGLWGGMIWRARYTQWSADLSPYRYTANSKTTSAIWNVTTTPAMAWPNNPNGTPNFGGPQTRINVQGAWSMASFAKEAYWNSILKGSVSQMNAEFTGYLYPVGGKEGLKSIGQGYLTWSYDDMTVIVTNAGASNLGWNETWQGYEIHLSGSDPRPGYPGAHIVSGQVDYDYYVYPYGGVKCNFTTFPFAYTRVNSGEGSHMWLILDGEARLAAPEGGFDPPPEGGHGDLLAAYCTLSLGNAGANIREDFGPIQAPGGAIKYPGISTTYARVVWEVDESIDQKAWCEGVAGAPYTVAPENNGYGDTPGPVNNYQMIEVLYNTRTGEAQQDWKLYGEVINNAGGAVAEMVYAGYDLADFIEPANPDPKLHPINAVTRVSRTEAIGVASWHSNGEVVSVPLKTSDGGRTWTASDKGPPILPGGGATEVIPMECGGLFLISNYTETVTHGEGEDTWTEYRNYTTIGTCVDLTTYDVSILYSDVLPGFSRSHIRVGDVNTVVYLRPNAFTNLTGMTQGEGIPWNSFTRLNPNPEQQTTKRVELPGECVQLFVDQLKLGVDCQVYAVEMTYVPPELKQGAPPETLIPTWSPTKIRYEMNTVDFEPPLPTLNPTLFTSALNKVDVRVTYRTGMKFELRAVRFGKSKDTGVITVTDTSLGYIDESARRADNSILFFASSVNSRTKLLAGNDWPA